MSSTDQNDGENPSASTNTPTAAIVSIKTHMNRSVKLCVGQQDTKKVLFCVYNLINRSEKPARKDNKNMYQFSADRINVKIVQECCHQIKMMGKSHMYTSTETAAALKKRESHSL